MGKKVAQRLTPNYKIKFERFCRTIASFRREVGTCNVPSYSEKNGQNSIGNRILTVFFRNQTGRARSFFGHFFFTKKKRFSAKIQFPCIFAQITFTQSINCVNCAGEAVKSDNIPTCPAKTAQMHPKKKLKYDSLHSASQIDFYAPHAPQRTPFIPLHPCTTVHHTPQCTTHRQS